jgi:acylphosphatase
LRPHTHDATLVYVPDPIPTTTVVKHFLVQGRVQGVGFRWFVHREAAGIGLRGWVRNTPDGHVEIVAAGTPGQLDQLADAIHKGSRGSRVDRVLEHPLEDSEANNLNEFQIEGAW